MIRDYMITSPSLEGILGHGDIEYEKVSRPEEIKFIFDHGKPNNLDKKDTKKRKNIEDYYHDVYGLLLKKITKVAIESTIDPEDEVKIQALLQEFIKVKKLLA